MPSTPTKTHWYRAFYARRLPPGRYVKAQELDDKARAHGISRTAGRRALRALGVERVQFDRARFGGGRTGSYYLRPAPGRAVRRARAAVKRLLGELGRAREALRREERLAVKSRGKRVHFYDWQREGFTACGLRVTSRLAMSDRVSGRPCIDCDDAACATTTKPMRMKPRWGRWCKGGFRK